VDFSDLDHSTLNLTLGQSGNPASPYYLDQFLAWYRGTTYPLAFSDAAAKAAAQHTLTLQP
jgi:penicillin amidase